ncbi:MULTISPECIES: SMP-30/gluconolactonase/LRE family protein [Alphaproteobacteria]|uniref:Gluconolactonase n=2 Tax=Alphaproteobacteria TaxID=28211 RepID=A0A934WIV1_9RHOB|nr:MULTISPECIES: SMP-30/gluconolactonase/LRE family protein [Alphaproteobacteria]MBK1699118.1 gluconolactonase [Rhodovibrio salinarum]MBK5927194.1 gluconolactonase [Rhodobaculum claviforme]
MNDSYQVYDSRFRALVQPNAWLERLWTGARWTEGPVYFADTDVLVFSDIPNNRMMRWVDGMGAGVFRCDSNYANGNTRDRQARLVTAEHGGRRITRTEPDGTVTVLADRFEGKPLNSPNDLVVKSDGTVWFTDPPYGIISDYEGHKAAQEQTRCRVYRLEPESGRIDAVAEDFVKPNGLAFSPDERVLYISDTGASHDPDGPHHIRAFDVEDGRRLTGARVFAEVSPGVPDGFRLDTDGNLWTSAGDGVHCYAPDGALLGKIPVPEVVANVTFGGAKRNRLFITATSSLYAIFLSVSGAQAP